MLAPRLPSDLGERAPELCNTVERALRRWPAGMALRALDLHVRWATGRSLGQWVRAIRDSVLAEQEGSRGSRPQSEGDTLPRGDDDPQSDNDDDDNDDGGSVRECEGDQGDAWERVALLRRVPAVGSVERIAGHAVVYPAWSRSRRSDVRRGFPSSSSSSSYYALCAGSVPGGVVVVDTVEACRAAVSDLARRRVVALDCEGTSIARGSHSSPGIALIQMTARGSPCYLFDMCRPDAACSGRNLMHHGGLGALLSDPHVLKVVQDAREDARALGAVYGCRLSGVFDTQEAHMWVDGGTKQRLGLNTLLGLYGIEANHHKDAMRSVYPVDQWCWHRRPLARWMVEYAVADVVKLIDLYDALLARAAPADFDPRPRGGHDHAPPGAKERTRDHSDKDRTRPPSGLEHGVHDRHTPLAALPIIVPMTHPPVLWA
jgi:hypothetical protein